MSRIRKSLALIAILGSLMTILTGCKSWFFSSKENDDDLAKIEAEIIDDTKSDVSLSWSMNPYHISACGFDLDGNQNGMLTVRRTKQDNDIRDMANFSCAVYRQKLQNKLQSGEALTQGDVHLLNFCIMAQISALNAYSTTALSDMLNETQIPTARQRKMQLTDDGREPDKQLVNFSQQIEDICDQLDDEFRSSDGVFRKKIREWGNCFNGIDDKVLYGDFKKIQDSSKQKIGSFQWGQLWCYVPYVQLITLCWEKELHEDAALRPYKNFTANDLDTAAQWRMLNNTLARNVKYMQMIFNDCSDYLNKASDARSIQEVDNIRISTDNELRSALTLSAFVFSDLPLTVFCKQAAIGIQNCKHAYDDDEDEMEAVMNKFFVRASDPNMLLEVKSLYTVDLYKQLINDMFKSELGTTRFNSYKEKTKFSELDQLNSDYFGKNTLK